MQKSKIRFLIGCFMLIGLIVGVFVYERLENQENTAILPTLPDEVFQQALSHEDSLFLGHTKAHQDTILVKWQVPQFDYEFVITEKDTTKRLYVMRHNRVYAQKKLPQLFTLNQLSYEVADLNYNDIPEVYLFYKTSNETKLLAYELGKNTLIGFSLPPLYGRQAFGYAGHDTLFIADGKVIRQFRFKNAQFAPFPSGTRTCEYNLGFDLKFSMSKSLDTE
ncbi:hypothetical protein [Flectobacillus major]|jgi:hypothetical protein|uniref:hypothetical protein n=1 Tax=Flectobacillus major TaxID=103 RepID=UPI0004204E2D|nr:hypothetical protein [Flectobacillus major]